ncbi:MFS transporter [Acetobacteraceae bacterium H6797]|nr:MFS transporter [Acetobacteraceae bacterium H6797]
MTERPAADAQTLTRKDARTLGLAALGGALEFYDFIIFVFFAAVIGKLFFPANSPDWLLQIQTFGLFAAGYLARPLGGIIMAHFGDKSGRKRMFTLSVFLMALPTLAIGLMPTYESIGYAAPILLLLMRMLQGAAIGGEAPGAWVFVAEHVPANRVGLATGMLTGGLTGGILIGSLIATAVNVIWTPDEVLAHAWRYPFLIGGVFGFVAMYLRRWLHETPVFEKMRAARSLEEGLPLKQALKGHLGSVAVSMIATWMLTAAIVVVILMTPTLMQKVYHIPASTTLMGSVAATLTLTIGAIWCGDLLDRFGTAKVATVGMLGLIVTTYALYIGVVANPGLLVALHALAGAFVGVITVVPYVMVRAFPPATRFSGVSFSYNVAYAIFGGITPLLVASMLAFDKLAPAHYVAVVTLIGLVGVTWRRGVKFSRAGEAEAV